MIILPNFPVPPSVNTHLIPVMGALKFDSKGKPYRAGRFVKSRSHKDYSIACNLWAKQYQKGLAEFRSELDQLHKITHLNNQTFALRMESYICLKEDRFITEKGNPQRIDADNYSKALQDNLFRILDRDDSCIFKVELEKICILDASPECVYIRLSHIAPRSFDQMKRLLK